MKSKSNSKSWLITVGVAGAAVAFVWFVFLPGQKAISALRDELLNKRTFAMNLTRFTTDGREVQRDIERAREYVDRSNQTLVASSDMPRLYAEIAAVAKQAGVETTRFSPDPAIPYARFVKFPVNLGCEGSFQQVGALIEGLERLPYWVWIETVSFEESGEASGLLRCELNLEVFAKNSGFSG